MTPVRTCTVFIIPLLIILGCTEDPTSVGVNILPGTDFPLFSADTLDASAFSTTKAIPSTLAPDFEVLNWIPNQLFIGAMGQLTASTLIKFNKLPDSLQGIEVTGAEIVLLRQSAIGDSTSVLPITMYRGASLWVGDSLTGDSLTARPGYYFNTTPLPPGVPTGTSDPGAFQIPLDIALVQSWFVSTVDSGSANLGVLIQSSATTSLRGYASFNASSDSLRPKLRVAYRKSGIPGSILLTNGYARYVASLPHDPTRLYVQNGVAYRASLSFDVTGLPRPLSLNDARLELTLDGAASSFTTGPLDSLYAFFVGSDGSVYKSSGTLGSTGTSGGNPTFSFPIYRFGREWVRNSIPARVVLAGFSENMNFNRFVIYDTTAAQTLKPRLIMTYSRPQLEKEGR